MNAKQRKILIGFKDARVGLTCDCEDCRKEFQASLKKLLELCDEAEREERVAQRTSKQRREWNAAQRTAKVKSNDN